jgi:rRNA maturation endonuclease Nob1
MSAKGWEVYETIKIIQPWVIQCEFCKKLINHSGLVPIICPYCEQPTSKAAELLLDGIISEIMES